MNAGTHPFHCDVRLGQAAVRDFLAPQYVLNGDGAAKKTGDALRAWGVGPGRALVICDRFLFEAGALAGLLDGLRTAGFDVAVFPDVTREPTVADADAAVAHARALRPATIVGVGGGSSMDLAKVVALLVNNDGPVEAHIGADLPERPPAPFALVPTTTGTGAETTRISMLAAPGGKRIVSHRMLVPLVAVLDVDLVMKLPGPVTAATGMDALTHATESFLSTSSSALSASMSLRAAQLLSEWLPIACDRPDDRKARRATLYGAFLAGLSLNAGVVLGHSMAYTVANRAHLPHGVTTAMALPFCLAYNASAEVEAIDQLALALSNGRHADLRSVAKALIELNDRLGIAASPRAAGIERSELAPMARECVTKYPRPTNPVPMTDERVTALYDAWFAGDLDAAWSV
jgi:alcohol dehydrogenase class IV